jgi:hypothetical protein
MILLLIEVNKNRIPALSGLGYHRAPELDKHGIIMVTVII